MNIKDLMNWQIFGMFIIPALAALLVIVTYPAIDQMQLAIFGVQVVRLKALMWIAVWLSYSIAIFALVSRASDILHREGVLRGKDEKNSKANAEKSIFNQNPAIRRARELFSFIFF